MYISYNNFILSRTIKVRTLVTPGRLCGSELVRRGQGAHPPPCRMGPWWALGRAVSMNLRHETVVNMTPIMAMKDDYGNDTNVEETIKMIMMKTNVTRT